MYDDFDSGPDCYADLLKEAYENEYNPGWAYYRYKEEYSEKPDISWALHACLGEHPSSKEIVEYLEYLICTYNGQEKAFRKVQCWLQAELGEDFKARIKACKPTAKLLMPEYFEPNRYLPFPHPLESLRSLMQSIIQ